jgi:hypothetical protein
LSLRTGLSHGNNSLWLNGINGCLELFYLNLNELPLALYLKFKLILGQLYFIFVLLFNKFEVGILLNSLRVNQELSFINFSLGLDEIGLCLRSGIRNGKTCRADSLILGLKFQEVLVDFLILNLSLNFKALQHAICFLL